MTTQLPPPNPDHLSAAWSLLPLYLRLRIYLATWLHLNRHLRPLLLPFLHAVLSFIILFHLPIQPSSMFIAYMLALLLIITIYSLISYISHTKGTRSCPSSNDTC